MDVDRTFKGTKFFSEKDKSTITLYMDRLKNVLKAYSVKNKKVG